MRRLVFSFLSVAVPFGLIIAGCSSTDANGPTGSTAGTGNMGQAGSTGMAGNMAGGGSPGVGGNVATAGSAGSQTVGGAGGSAPVAGAGGMSGSAGSGGAAGGSGGSGGGSSTGSLGCNMDPGANDSATQWVKHDIDVTGVDPAFVTKYPVNAGKTYNWTHRNYFLRLPTNYDPSKPYPIMIGGSGCGGTDTVGSEGGYAVLKAGQTEVIQVALSYVLSSAANADCGGAVFADGFTNSPEVQYLAAVVKDVQGKYCANPKKVFLGGYSSGAFEATTLGCSNANILRGIGIQIGGGLRQHAPMPCTGKVAGMFVVGKQDNANPIGPLAQPLNDSLGSAPARDELLARNGCTGTDTKPWDPDYPACVTYTGCPAEYPVVWCPIDSGHTPTADDAAVGKYRYDGLAKFWTSLP